MNRNKKAPPPGKMIDDTKNTSPLHTQQRKSAFSLLLPPPYIFYVLFTAFLSYFSFLSDKKFYTFNKRNIEI
jgi:hypothetical protein